MSREVVVAVTRLKPVKHKGKFYEIGDAFTCSPRDARVFCALKACKILEGVADFTGVSEDPPPASCVELEPPVDESPQFGLDDFGRECNLDLPAAAEAGGEEATVKEAVTSDHVVEEEAQSTPRRQRGRGRNRDIPVADLGSRE